MWAKKANFELRAQLPKENYTALGLHVNSFSLFSPNFCTYQLGSRMICRSRTVICKLLGATDLRIIQSLKMDRGQQKVTKNKKGKKELSSPFREWWGSGQGPSVPTISRKHQVSCRVDKKIWGCTQTRAGGRDSGMAGRPWGRFAKRQKQTVLIPATWVGDLQRWGLRTAKHNPGGCRSIEPLLPGIRFPAVEGLRLIINEN